MDQGSSSLRREYSQHNPNSRTYPCGRLCQVYEFIFIQAGGCPANLQAVADDANRCWWTCGGCTRQTDIVSCPQKLTWGLTYDDGPSAYTPDLLNFLGQHNIKGTFFAIGSRAISLPAILQAEYMEGHQVAGCL